MPEHQLGPYRLVQPIATGGMAEVYLATTRGIGGFEKHVAVKMIHPNFSSDEHFIQMLVDEAKLAVKLQHANIAQVFDLGRVADTYYITMEYVDGCDLYRVLRSASEKEEPFPLDVAVFIAKEACAGLDYAHGKRDDQGTPLGIVHRDISPQNVLISHAGEVKIVDFGIAKATLRARTTAAGVIKGKYYYMSPEQAWGWPLDHRTDIFSAGILLYEMLTGQMLYLEDDFQLLLEKVRRANIQPPSSRRRDVPRELDLIVMKALAKHPEHRYQAAADFTVALERFLNARAPDFSVARVTRFLSMVMGAPAPASMPSPRPNATPGRVTKGLASEVFTSRAEFTDENSLIFHAGEGGPNSLSLRHSGDEETIRPRAPLRPDPAVPRMPDMHTPHVPVRSMGFDAEEKTVLSAPPAFLSEGEADPPTQSRQGEDDDDLEDALTARLVSEREETPFDEDELLDAPTKQHRRKKDLPDALAGHNPVPALSVLSPPRPSRRTPHGGVKVPDLAQVDLAQETALDAAPPVLGEGTRHEPTAELEVLDLSEDPPLQDLLAESAQRSRRTVTWIASLATAIGLLVLGVGAMERSKPARPPSSLEVVSFPRGASVSVDGKLVGAAPVLIDPAQVGHSYRIRVEMAKHEPWEQDEPIPEAGRRIKRIAVLRPIYGTLHVHTAPPGAEVFLGNESLGRTPLHRDNMDPFVDSTIEVRLRGHKPERRKLTWNGQREATLRFDLKQARD
ncbi:MAG: serine/threonine protein kinase [Deltaproteobacteria bacterium]|nr:serine/threonine protein kinase [Deltaproteobacteria bacterium]